jgi:hypothetical protein
MIPRRTLGVAVIAVLPLVAACGAGRDTTTDKERQTPYVASTTAGPLFLTAAALVPSQAATSGTTGDTSATPSSSPSPSESGGASLSPSASASASTGSNSGSAGSADAYLVVTVYNRGGQPDQLTGAQVRGASVTPRDQSASSLTVAPQQALRFVDPEFGGEGPVLEVSGFTQPIQDGTAMPVTFQFQNAGSVTLLVPVRTADSAGTTATSTPLPLTGSYPSSSEEPEGIPSGG